MDILTRIVSDRNKRIAEEGYALGEYVPPQREVPLIPFAREPGVICEVKRKSPSKGDIAPGLNAVAQAGRYADAGVRSISVLTEGQYFGGSLKDLMDVKKQFPDVAVLRKDFLVDIEDIRISYRAGADAVLLIAAMLEPDVISEMYHTAHSMGLAALVEIHDRDDADKVRAIKPYFTGINSRDLRTFRVDPIIPLRVRRHVDWHTRLVFESGLRRSEDARFARSNGFSAILVGEAAVKDPTIIQGLTDGMNRGAADVNADFWYRLFSRKSDDAPLVKVCGITNREDAAVATELGADMLGFVLAESPRRVDMDVVRACSDLDVLKVGVVVDTRTSAETKSEASLLMHEGVLDAVQFHGDESSDMCSELAFPYYKAVRVGSVADIEAMQSFRCPRVLMDAFTQEARGGTGKQIATDLLASIPEGTPMWIAGGLGAHNVADIVQEWRPELVDASSMLEEHPGKKDRTLLRRYIEDAKSARAQ